jgi:hypothetical protein
MNDQPRQALGELIARYGPGVADDPRRCEALLRDLAGAHKRELNVLSAALRAGIPGELQQTPGGVPVEMRLATLSERLANDQAMDPTAARWAVDAWAVALGVTATPAPPVSAEAVAQYRAVLQFAAHAPMAAPAVQRLQGLADQLRLTPEQAMHAERAVLGDTKEALLLAQSAPAPIAPPPAQVRLHDEAEPVPDTTPTPPLSGLASTSSEVQVTLRREREWGFLLPLWEEFVDGQRSGQIANDEELEFSVAPGQHVVHVECGLKKTAPLYITAHVGEVIALICRDNRWGRLELRQV